MVEEVMKIKPLTRFPIIKDLVIDRRSVFEQVMSLCFELYILKKNGELGDSRVSDAGKFLCITNCFECLIYQSPCPVCTEAQEESVGPLGILWLREMSPDPKNRLIMKSKIKATLNLYTWFSVCSDACICVENVVGLAIDTLQKLWQEMVERVAQRSVMQYVGEISKT